MNGKLKIMLCGVLLTLWSAKAIVADVVYKDENLVRNSSFEDKSVKDQALPSEWQFRMDTPDGAECRCEGDGHSGKQAAYIKISKPNKGVVGWFQPLPLDPDVTYTASACVKYRNLPPNSAFLFVGLSANFEEGKSVDLSRSAGYFQGTNDWTYCKFNFTTPKTLKAGSYIYPVLLQNADEGEVWIDEVAVVRGTEQMPLSEDVAASYRTTALEKLDNVLKKIEHRQASSGVDKEWKEWLEKMLASLDTRLKGVLRSDDIEEMRDQIESVEGFGDAYAAGKFTCEKLIPYVIRPIQNKRVLPDTLRIPGDISNVVSIVAAQGEYEPASFVVHATTEIKGLELAISSLVDKEGHEIKSENIGVRVVKCWHQDEGARYQEVTPAITYNPMWRAHKKVLVPELLLRNDSLVYVDDDKSESYLKTEKDGAVSYMVASGADKNEGVNGAENAPVDDSTTLLPVNVKQNQNKQFWLTLHVPEQTHPGIYESEICLTSGKSSLGRIRLRVKVLPFALEPPYYISSIYINWNPTEAELINLVSHGVTNPSIVDWGGWGKELQRCLELRRKNGISENDLFYQMCVNNPSTNQQLLELQEKIKNILETAKAFGVKNTCFYGIDEALSSGSNDYEAIGKLVSQRQAWETVHEAGGKIYVSGVPKGFFPENDKRHVGNFGYMGDIQDVIVCYGYPTREEAARWHGKGHKILCYGNPQGGVEQPETYRKNYGLLLWQNDYDGAMTYCYRWYWGDFVEKVGNVPPIYKQHNMIYKTKNGVIDTIQWEGYREGVDDVRYMTTLLKAIAKAEKGNAQERKRAEEAKNYLATLKDMEVNKHNLNMDVVRLEIIEHILKLMK